MIQRHIHSGGLDAGLKIGLPAGILPSTPGPFWLPSELNEDRFSGAAKVPLCNATEKEELM